MKETLYLGNLSAKRNWGDAVDYIKAMYLLLKQDKPEDSVISTGITNEVRDFVRMAFIEVGVTIVFKGEGVEEIGIATNICNDKILFKYLIQRNT